MTKKGSVQELKLWRTWSDSRLTRKSWLDGKKLRPKKSKRRKTNIKDCSRRFCRRKKKTRHIRRSCCEICKKIGKLIWQSTSVLDRIKWNKSHPKQLQLLGLRENFLSLKRSQTNSTAQFAIMCSALQKNLPHVTIKSVFYASVSFKEWIIWNVQDALSLSTRVSGMLITICKKRWDCIACIATVVKKFHLNSMANTLDFARCISMD